MATGRLGQGQGQGQGRIVVQRLIDRIRDPQPARLALTGGTGAFRTAHGEMIALEPDAQLSSRSCCASSSARTEPHTKGGAHAGVTLPLSFFGAAVFLNAVALRGAHVEQAT